MRIFDPSDDSNLVRLTKSLNGAMPTSNVGASRVIDGTLAQQIFGSSDDFISRYKEFEENYYRFLGDRSRLSPLVGNIDIDLERKSGKLDLSRLNYDSQQELMDIFRTRVLNFEQLLSQAGLPGREYESGNLYRALLQYETEGDSHAANILLGRTYFNIDPTKAGFDAIRFGTSNMLSSSTLERLSYQRSNMAAIEDEMKRTNARIMTFDVETTGVMRDSQIRQFAYQVEQVTADGSRMTLDPTTLRPATDPLEMVTKSFENTQMDLARITTPSGQSFNLSRFVNELEGRQGISMADGGRQFVEESKALISQMLEVEHVSGHNVLFDIGMLRNTLESLSSFHEDEVAQGLLSDLYSKIETNKSFLIDTAESTREYFNAKAMAKFAGDPDAAQKYVAQILGPESKTMTMLGGSTAPVSVENIALNSNLFQLIEEEDQELAKRITQQLKMGSHVADTDVALQASIERFRRSGKLDFRFDETGVPVGRALSDFEQYARNQVLKSSAIVPTTNIASVRHVSQGVFDFVTSDEGMKRVRMTAEASELGLTGTGRGVLSYDREAEKFSFRRFGATTAAEDVLDQTARDVILQNLQEARRLGQGTDSVINIGRGATQVAKRNLADEKILSLGLNYIQATGIDEAQTARRLTAGITAASLPNNDQFIRSLGLTMEQFGRPQSRTFKQMFSTRTPEEKASDIGNPMEYSRESIDSYYLNAANAGLPFHQLSVANRAYSVAVAQSTSSVSQIGKANLPSAVYAQNADLLSEMGISFFRTQVHPRIGMINAAEGQMFPSSKVMLPFFSMFDVDTTTDADNAVTRTLSVKAFEGKTGVRSGNIMSTDLNRFTMSYVTGTGEGESFLPSRVNLVWGANSTLSRNESKVIAESMLDNVGTFRETLEAMASQDQGLSREIGELIQLGTSMESIDTTTRNRIVDTLSSHIRDRGIVLGYVEGDAADAINASAARRGIDLAGNDVRSHNFAMRIAHVHQFEGGREGVLAMSALSDVTEDLATGRTSQVAQRETSEAFDQFIEANKLLNDPAKRRAAKRAIRDASTAGGVDRAVDLTKDVVREFMTPMRDFYVNNKKPLGIAGIGLTVASLGYYMYKKKSEQNLYDESVAYMPTGSPTSKPRREISSVSQPKSTRRDPLVTAGVVGNLDRNKIGHTQMGPNKYNHLYGG